MATDEELGIIFCEGGDSRNHPLYDGFKPGSEVLPRHATHIEGGLALPCDILYERDVAVKLRDGVTIYVDIYRRPGAKKGTVPAIVSAGIFGKRGGNNRDFFSKLPWRAGVPQSTVSGLEKFEALDPAYWCLHGYAIVAPDVRGCWMSEGNTYVNCTSDGRDGYDLVEWIAAQSWSNKRVSYAGNSWLSQTQWFIAAEQPPHLTCIAPWEGWNDLYNDDAMRGGIPQPEFQQWLLNVASPSLSKTEDISAMSVAHPLFDEYWRDRRADLSKINVPMYVTASWTNLLHTRGTLKGYIEAPSADKWLRIHNSHEWPDLYYPQNVEDLRKFFDFYLKGIQNDWQYTPKVRMCVLDPGGQDIINRPEAEFPLRRQKPTSMFLHTKQKSLSLEPSLQAESISFDGPTGILNFDFEFEKETEITGFSSLRLWVEAVNSDDIDLYANWKKLDASGESTERATIDVGYLQADPTAEVARLWEMRKEGSVPDLFFSNGPYGQQRVSHRELDETLTTDLWPRYTHSSIHKLRPKEIVEVVVELWPHGMIFHKGEKLVLTIAGHKFWGEHLPFIKKPNPTSGEVVLHCGGDFSARLLLPVIENDI